MSLLVQLGSIVDFNPAMLETVFAKIGTPYTREQFADRLARARYWLEQCAPEQVNRLRTTRNFEVYDTLSDEEKAEIARLHDYLAAGGYTLDELRETIPMTEEDAGELPGLLGAFLARCDSLDRRLFVGRYWYARPVRDMALAYGLTPNTVSQRLRRTRLELKQFLEERGYRI